jgi:hypothetical protein
VEPKKASNIPIEQAIALQKGNLIKAGGLENPDNGISLLSWIRFIVYTLFLLTLPSAAAEWDVAAVLCAVWQWALAGVSASG